MGTTIQQYFQLQREDFRKLFLLGIVFFVAGIAEMLNYTSFMAIFNSRVGTASLPIMYVVEAIILPIEGWLLSVLSQRLSKPKFMTTLYIVFISVCLFNGAILLAFKWLGINIPFFYYLLFLTSNFVVRQQTLLMWSTAFDLSPTQQAKRLMPVFVLIAIFGGIIAGILSSVLATSLGPELLYILGAVLLASGLPNFIRAIRKYLVPLSFQSEMQETAETSIFYWKSILRSPFLMLVIGVMTFMPALYLVAEYQYFTKAQETFVIESELTAFYGLMVIILFAAAFVLQLISTKLMDKLGATNMIISISIIFLVCFLLASFFVSTHIALFIVSIGYSFTYLLLYYFAEPSYQFFFKMLPIQHRDGYRYTAQGISASLGILLGSLLSILHSHFHVSLSLQAIIAVLLAVVLCVISWLTKSLYMKQLVSNLQMTANDKDYFSELWSFLRTEKFRKLLKEQLQSGTKEMKQVLLELIRKQPDTALDPDIWSYAAIQKGDAKIQALKALHPGSWLKLEINQFEQLLADEDEGVRAISYHYLFQKQLSDEQFNHYIKRALEDSHVWSHREAWRVMEVSEVLYGYLRGQLALQNDASIYAIDIIVERKLEELTMDVMYAMLSEVQSVKLAAVKAIGKLGNQDLIPSFMELLIGADIELVAAIKQSLLDLAVENKSELIRFVQSPNNMQWSIAMQVFRHVATDQELSDIIVPSCIQKMNEASATYSLYYKILQTGEQQWIQLAKQRTDEIVLQQLNTIWDVMEAYSDERAIEKLREALEHPDEEIRDQGLEVLSEGFGDRRLNEALLRFYKQSQHADQSARSLADKEAFQQINDAWLQAIAIKTGVEKGEQLLMNNWEYLSSIERVVFLKQVPLFENISVEELGKIASIAKERTYKEDDVLITQGESAHTLFIVKSGVIEISGENEEGIIGTLGVISEKQSFGEASLFTQTVSQISAQVLFAEAELLEISSYEMLKLVRLYPDIGIGLLKTVSQRLSNLEQIVVKLG